MKLVELLAAEMHEWPKFTEGGDSIEQDYNNSVIEGHGCGTVELFMLSQRADDFPHAHVTRAQWQAERDRQKAGEWKRHRGGDKPKSFSDGEMVEVWLRDGAIMTSQADEFIWNHGDCDESANIIKYRVISQPQAEEVEVNAFVGKDVKIEYAYAQEGVEPEHLEWKTMGTAKIDNIFDLGPMEAKTDQIDGPIKWRDQIVELEAHAEDIQREITSLFAKLNSEGFQLIRQYHSVSTDVPDVDMSDWRNLKEGDIIECGDKGWSSSFEGVRVTVKEIESVDYTGSLPINGVDDNGDEDWGESYTFIRRP